MLTGRTNRRVRQGKDGRLHAPSERAAIDWIARRINNRDWTVGMGGPDVAAALERWGLVVDPPA